MSIKKSFTENESIGITSYGIKHIRTKYGWSGYGLYRALLDEIPKWHPRGKITAPDFGHIAIDLGITEHELVKFLEWCACDDSVSLFYTEDNGFSYTSVYIAQQLEKAEHIKKVRAQAAKVRWDKRRHVSKKEEATNEVLSS